MKFFIVDNFLSKENNYNCLQECLSLWHIMKPGKVGPAGEPVEKLSSDIKRNFNIWLDTAYKYREESFILRTLLPALWTSEMRANYIKMQDVIFGLLNHTSNDCTLVSAYGNGDYYNSHKDQNGVCSFNYMLCHEPKMFRGGEFVLEGFNGEEQEIVEFKNNRLVVFPSDYLHSVKPIFMLTDKPAHMRWTIQNFPSR